MWIVAESLQNALNSGLGIIICQDICVYIHIYTCIYIRTVFICVFICFVTFSMPFFNQKGDSPSPGCQAAVFSSLLWTIAPWEDLNMDSLGDDINSYGCFQKWGYP